MWGVSNTKRLARSRGQNGKISAQETLIKPYCCLCTERVIGDQFIYCNVEREPVYFRFITTIASEILVSCAKYFWLFIGQSNEFLLIDGTFSTLGFPLHTSPLKFCTHVNWKITHFATDITGKSETGYISFLI